MNKSMSMPTSIPVERPEEITETPRSRNYSARATNALNL